MRNLLVGLTSRSTSASPRHTAFAVQRPVLRGARRVTFHLPSRPTVARTRSCRRPGPLRLHHDGGASHRRPDLAAKREPVTPADPAVGPDELHDRLHLDLLRRAHRRGVGRVAVVDHAVLHGPSRLHAERVAAVGRRGRGGHVDPAGRERPSPGAEETGLEHHRHTAEDLAVGSQHRPAGWWRPRRSPDPRWSGRVSRRWSPPPRPRAGCRRCRSLPWRAAG